MILKFNSMKDNAENILKSILEDSVTYETDFEKLNYLLNGGISEGQLIVVGGESGTGKSTFCLQLSEAIASSEVPIIYFSLEMSELEIFARAVSRQSFLNKQEGRSKYAFSAGDIMAQRTSEEAKKKVDPDSYHLAVKDYNNVVGKNFYVVGNNAGRVTVDDMFEMAENNKELFDKKPVIVVDYLQLLSDPKEKDIRMRINSIVADLKNFSLQYQLPVICISSLNRSSYKEATGKDISLGSFKESGEIEYTANVVIAINCDEKEKSKSVRNVKVSVIKNRNGAIGDIKMKYYADYGYFDEE